MEKILITDAEKLETAKELDRNPKLKRLIMAAETLTPEDLDAVLTFVNERKAEDLEAVIGAQSEAARHPETLTEQQIINNRFL